MRFQVTKSSPPVLVGPSEPTPGGSFLLTSTDKSRLCLSFTSLHVFQRPIHRPAETIRRVLSHALAHYYPVAGRLVDSGDGVVQVACTGEGVPFVSATAKYCTLEDIRFLHAPLVVPLADLAPRYGGRCGMSDPLLMAQVTEFACGGYVVGVTWNHGIADGFGVAQLLCAVGELARGRPMPSSSPSLAPVRYDASLPEIPDQLAALRPSLAVLRHVDFAYTDVIIPWSFINRVKADFIRSDDVYAGEPTTCTTFEVIAAAIWQCRTRAINADEPADSLALLMFTASVRKHVGAKEGYYGNCITSVLVRATSGAVADGDVLDVVKLIRRAKEQIPAKLNRPEELAGAFYWYGAMILSSWRGIGMDAVDLGGGRPKRVVADMERTTLPTCTLCPGKDDDDDDGVNVVAVCVTEEHRDGFHAQLAKLR